MSAVLAWLGIWSLATGWLLLSGFFLPADDRGWAFFGAGALLFVLAARRARWQRVDPWLYLLAVPLLAPAITWPFPHKAGPLLLLGGLLLSLPGAWDRRKVPGRRGWGPPARHLSKLTPLGLGLGLAGAVWIAQSGTAVAYWWLGARTHEATFLTPLVYALSKLLGWKAGSSAGMLFLPNIEEMVQATTTWERLGTFPAMLLGGGGLVLLPFLRWGGWGRLLGRLAGALVLGCGYVLVRYLVLTAALAITRDPVIFWLPLLTALTFLPLGLLLARALPLRQHLPEPLAATRASPARRYAALAGLGLLAGAATIALLTFPDPGRQKAGRVLLDEHNSNWEWTTQALGTEWYGQKSGYNYYSLGQWLQDYHQVDTNFEPRSPALLANYDVLIIKTPTAPFTPEEIQAIEAWVRAGGGLFLIGDHTNVFGTSSYLNPLARQFGLRFRYDSTYDLATLRVTLYQRPELLAHPAVLTMPPFLFATSCTLEAPLLAGNVMVGYGLRSLAVDYSKRVFFPDKEKINDYPFGLFLQSAAVHHGQGRVIAFTDSTVFSNFTMFMPGKPEYFLGVMNWLNHSERWPWLDGALVLLALLATAGVIYQARSLDRRRAGLVVLGGLLLAAGIVPWVSIRLAYTEYRLPTPQTEPIRIAFEEEHSQIALPTAPATSPAEASYQTFYVWTQRLGYVPALASTLGQALQQGQVVVLIDPLRPFEADEMAAVEAFVTQGGRLLVLAEPRESGQIASPTGQILAPFGLSLEARSATTGQVRNALGEPLGQLQVGGVVTGGEPLLTLEGSAPIVGLAHHGAGLVAVAAFSRPFTDREMGTTAVIPSAHQRFLFEIEFWLLRSLVAGEFSPLNLPADAGG